MILHYLGFHLVQALWWQEERVSLAWRQPFPTHTPSRLCSFVEVPSDMTHPKENLRNLSISVRLRSVLTPAQLLELWLYVWHLLFH